MLSIINETFEIIKSDLILESDLIVVNEEVKHVFVHAESVALIQQRVSCNSKIKFF